MILFLKHVLIDSIRYVVLLIVSTRHVDKYIAWYLLYVKFPKTEQNVFLIYVDLFTKLEFNKTQFMYTGLSSFMYTYKATEQCTFSL